MIRTESGDEGGDGVCGPSNGGGRTRIRENCSSPTNTERSMKREASIISEELLPVNIGDDGR